MDLNSILNITGINVVEEIEKSINNVKMELSGLTTDLTCKIYNSYLLEELRKHHVLVRLINTKDIGIDYEHYFLLISSVREYFLADLTYPQFHDETIPNLSQKGYIKIDNSLLNRYLSVVAQQPVIDYTCENLFYRSIDSKSKQI